MAKQSFVPRTDDKRKPWLKNFALKLPAYNVKYGIPAGELADTIAGEKYYSYWIDVLDGNVTYKQKVTGFKNEISNGVPPGAPLPVEPAAPVFGVVPPSVLPGIFPRAVSIGNRIKKHNDYVVSDGEDMGLEGAELLPPDLINSKPVLKIVLRAGQPLVQWKKEGFDALWIETDRDGTGYKFLAIDTEPDYLDTFALPPRAETWKYRAIFIFHDEKVAMWSDEVTVTVKA